MHGNFVTEEPSLFKTLLACRLTDCLGAITLGSKERMKSMRTHLLGWRVVAGFFVAASLFAAVGSGTLFAQSHRSSVAPSGGKVGVASVDLSHLAGYPDQTGLGEKGFKSVFSDPVFKQALRATLKEKYSVLTAAWGGGPALNMLHFEARWIDKSQSLASAGLGKPHDVGDHSLTVFFFLKGAHPVQALWHNERTCLWLVQGQADRALPASACQTLGNEQSWNLYGVK